MIRGTEVMLWDYFVVKWEGALRVASWFYRQSLLGTASQRAKAITDLSF